MECCAAEGGPGEANNVPRGGALPWPGGVQCGPGRIHSHGRGQGRGRRRERHRQRLGAGKTMGQNDVVDKLEVG